MCVSAAQHRATLMVRTEANRGVLVCVLVVPDAAPPVVAASRYSFEPTRRATPPRRSIVQMGTPMHTPLHQPAASLAPPPSAPPPPLAGGRRRRRPTQPHPPAPVDTPDPPLSEAARMTEKSDRWYDLLRRRPPASAPPSRPGAASAGRTGCAGRLASRGPPQAVTRRRFT